MLKITHFHLEKNKNSYCKIFNSLYFLLILLKIKLYITAAS